MPSIHHSILFKDIQECKKTVDKYLYQMVRQRQHIHILYKRVYMGPSLSLLCQLASMPYHETYTASFDDVSSLRGLLLMRHLIRKRCHNEGGGLLRRQTLERIVHHFRQDQTYLFPEQLVQQVLTCHVTRYAAQKWVVQVVDPSGHTSNEEFLDDTNPADAVSSFPTTFGNAIPSLSSASTEHYRRRLTV
jgi:hypothetical protein